MTGVTVVMLRGVLSIDFLRKVSLALLSFSGTPAAAALKEPFTQQCLGEQKHQNSILQEMLFISCPWSRSLTYPSTPHTPSRTHPHTNATPFSNKGFTRVAASLCRTAAPSLFLLYRALTSINEPVHQEKKQDLLFSGADEHRDSKTTVILSFLFNHHQWEFRKSQAAFRL